MIGGHHGRRAATVSQKTRAVTMPTKHIVITGASSGIGQATALRFAAGGASLVLAARGTTALELVARQCREAGGTALVVQTDVTDSAQVQSLAERALVELGQIDLWFSNVGVAAVGLFQETPIKAHSRIVDSNLMGHINDACRGTHLPRARPRHLRQHDLARVCRRALCGRLQCQQVRFAWLCRSAARRAGRLSPSTSAMSIPPSSIRLASAMARTMRARRLPLRRPWSIRAASQRPCTVSLTIRRLRPWSAPRMRRSG